MADLWELWGSGDELYEETYFEEEDDFGVQQVYAPEEILGRSAADFIGNVSELPPNVEVGTPPAQYRDMGIYGTDCWSSCFKSSNESCLWWAKRQTRSRAFCSGTIGVYSSRFWAEQ